MAHEKPLPRHIFDAIYKKYWSDVQWWARTAGVPAHDAEDLAQNVFIVLHLALSQGRFDPVYPRAWLIFVTVRMARDYVVRGPMRKARLAAGEFPILTIASSLRADQRALEREACERTDALLESIPEERRIVLEKIAFEGLTLAEVAEELGISPNTVASRLRLARRDVAKALARRKARERGMFLPPFAAISRRAMTWIAEARSALGRALVQMKAGLTSLGAGGGLLMGLGAIVVPPVQTSEPAPEVAPRIAVAVPAVFVNPAGMNAPMPATSSAAPLAAARVKSAIRPPSEDPERRSLDSIEALLATDPTAARIALDRHKQAFPQEKFAGARLLFESLVQAEVDRRRQASLRAAPP